MRTPSLRPDSHDPSCALLIGRPEQRIRGRGITRIDRLGHKRETCLPGGAPPDTRPETTIPGSVSPHVPSCATVQPDNTSPQQNLARDRTLVGPLAHYPFDHILGLPFDHTAFSSLAFPFFRFPLTGRSRQPTHWMPKAESGRTHAVGRRLSATRSFCLRT